MLARHLHLEVHWSGPLKLPADPSVTHTRASESHGVGITHDGGERGGDSVLSNCCPPSPEPHVPSVSSGSDPGKKWPKPVNSAAFLLCLEYWLGFVMPICWAGPWPGLTLLLSPRFGRALAPGLLLWGSPVWSQTSHTEPSASVSTSVLSSVIGLMRTVDKMWGAQ